METEKKMDMDQFAEDIKERLEQQGRFEVELKHVLKNNGVMRCGLILHSGGNNLAPTIYMESFFRAYRDGADMQEIIGKIMEAYEGAPGAEVDMSFFRDFSTVSDRLCMKLVNREANAELLEDLPYREFLDMAVVYYIDYDNPRTGAGTIQIHNSHMEMWGVMEGDLWEAASKNTPMKKPGRVESMRDILEEVFEEQGNGGEFRSSMDNTSVPMLVITNTERMYGAAVVMYSGLLKQAADKTGSDMFILPSSLHETIAIPVTEGRGVAELKEMVMEVNRNVLQPEEVLSDNVYIYRREQDRLEIA